MKEPQETPLAKVLHRVFTRFAGNGEAAGRHLPETWNAIAEAAIFHVGGKAGRRRICPCREHDPIPSRNTARGQTMKTYPLTPQQFAALRTRLLASGVTLPAEAYGTLAYSGITLKYSYDGQKLALSIQQKPFLIPSGIIWNKVDEWMAGV